MNIAIRKTPSNPTTPVPGKAPDPVEQRYRAMREYAAEYRRTRTFAPGEFEGFERKLLELSRDVVRETVAEELRSADVQAEAIEVEGKTLRRVLHSPQTYMTAAGPVEVCRWLYKDRRDDEARAFSPLESRIGIVEGYWTPEAAKQGLWVVSQMVPQKAEELFKRVGMMQPSKSSLDRMPKGVSDRWEQDREQFEAQLREQLVIPENATTVAVSIDGVLAPMEGTEPVEKRTRAANEGRLCKGPVGYRECAVGTLSFCDEQGNMLSAVRMARAPESKKVTLKSQVLAEVLGALERRPDLRVLKIADAGGDNWEFLGALCPDGEELIDFFHAAEHLHVALTAAYGEGTRETRYRQEELVDRLRDHADGVDSVIRALAYLSRKHPHSKVLHREVRYFRNNRGRMRYAHAIAQGLPIGSGVVEAACKTLVAQRLKLSGMRWGRGAQAILTTRGWDQSERFDAAWALVAATYQLEVSVLAHVVPIKQASR